MTHFFGKQNMVFTVGLFAIPFGYFLGSILMAHVKYFDQYFIISVFITFVAIFFFLLMPKTQERKRPDV